MIQIFSGFNAVPSHIYAPAAEPRFFGKAMDEDEAHQLHEESRQGCPLCLRSRIDSNPYLGEHTEEEVGEGVLVVPQEDFRQSIEAQGESQFYAGGHPECSVDEAFLGNVSHQLFGALRWKSKRLGKVALTRHGKALKKGYYPLFVGVHELIEAGLKVEVSHPDDSED